MKAIPNRAILGVWYVMIGYLFGFSIVKMGGSMTDPRALLFWFVGAGLFGWAYLSTGFIIIAAKKTSVKSFSRVITATCFVVAASVASLVTSGLIQTNYEINQMNQAVNDLIIRKHP